MDVSVCLDREMYRNKPKREDIGRLSKKIADERIDVDIEKLADYVGNGGRTFCPAVFTGGQRSVKQFEQMQLFVLDFDNGISYEEVKEMSENYELPISFSYHTFSSAEDKPKFRVVFMHGGIIQNRNIAELILAMLKKLFPQSDMSCFEISRMYFGGKGIIEVNKNAAFRLDQLAYYYQMRLNICQKNQYSREIKNIAGKYKIDLLDKNILNVCACDYGVFPPSDESEQEVVEKKVSSNIIYIQLPFFSTEIRIVQREWNNQDNTHRHHNHMRSMNKIDNVDIEGIRVKCRLFADFIRGESLSHAERFVLATNMIQIKDMKKVFLAIIKKFYDSFDKWGFILKYIEAMGYHPQGCGGNCPYAEQCLHDINLCLTLKGRRKITKVGEDHFVSVEDAYAELERCFMQAYQSDDRGLHIIKAQTGIGKTAVYIKALNNEDRLTVVAVPTVSLKHDVMRRVNKGKTVEALSLQDICLDKVCEKEIKALYDRGLYREARECLREYEGTLEDEGLKELIRQFRSLKEVIRKKEKNIIMTHAELLTLSEADLAGYQIIVDEDILMTIIKNMVYVDCDEVNRAIKEGLITGALKKELTKLLSMEDGSYMRSECWEQRYIDGDTLDRYHITGNINGIFTAKAYYIRAPDILYFNPIGLSNVKYIIMSATINCEVYKSFFYGRKIVLYDIPEAEYKGKLIQYTYSPMSRSNLEEVGIKYGGIKYLLNKLVAITSDKINYCITFKSFAEEIGTPYHFGNIEGLDTMSGMHGLIVGTAHKNECCYKLVACYLGVDVSKKEAQIRRQCIEHSGWRYNFMTYKDKMLRELQLYHMETEMEQAVGRSRLLRTDGVVFLFSNFPCRQAKLITDDYLTDRSEPDAWANASDYENII